MDWKYFTIQHMYMSYMSPRVDVAKAKKVTFKPVLAAFPSAKTTLAKLILKLKSDLSLKPV